MAPFLRWHRSILAQALVPLVVGTTAVVVIATWLNWRHAIAREEAAVMHQLAQRSQSRLLAEQPAFERVARQVRASRDLLQQRLLRQDAVRPLPDPDAGARRELPGASGQPVSVFVAAGAALDPAQVHAAAVARDLVTDLGRVIAEEQGNLTIAVAGRWMVGWGKESAELVDAMLPDDPVLLPAEQEVLGEPGPVRWSRAFTEPASDRRQVVAAATLDAPGVGRIAVVQALPIEDVLRRATTGQDPGAETVVIDATGSILAASSTGRLPVLPRLMPDGPPSELVPLPEGDGLVGVSRIAGPGWILATIHRRESIALEARSSARFAVILGATLLVAQSILLFLVLRTRVGRPLRQLADAATGMASGGRDLNLPTERRDEVGSLSSAFVAMAAAVAAREAELRSAAEALREREQMLSALIASAADAVMIIVDGRIAEANPRACSLFKADPGQLIGRRPEDLSPPRQPDGRTSAAAAVDFLRRTAAGEALHFPWTHQRVDGTPFDAEVGLALIALPGPSRLVAVVRDMTRRNELEAQLRQGQKLESLGQLAGGIAHDFNNMLAGIMGSAELILRSKDDARRVELARVIITAAERAAGLTGKLLAFARQGRVMSSVIDLHQVIADARQILSSTIDKRIAIELRLHAGSATVVGDASQLQNAIINLVVNARDAMPDGGRITIATELVEMDADVAAVQAIPVEPGRFIRMTVADTGCGIAPGVLPRIFEPFFTTKPIGKGTGLGLAAVWGTVRDHLGSIAVESRVGSGTCFSVLLPYTSEQPRRSSQLVPVVTSGRRGTVLLIDDEELVRSGAGMLLQELGWQVLEAVDGRHGVEVFQAERHRIDLVLVDMEMPRLRGIDCLRELRRIDPRVRAVLCSGFARDSEPAQLRHEGFCGQIPKPYRLAELQRVLDAAMAGR